MNEAAIIARAVHAYVETAHGRNTGPSADDVLAAAGLHHGPVYSRLLDAILTEAERRLEEERSAAVRGAQCGVCGRDGFAGPVGLDIHLRRYCSGEGLERLAKAYVQHPEVPVTTLASEAGVSTATLYKELARLGVPLRTSGRTGCGER